jgi:hypothetical protein
MLLRLRVRLPDRPGSLGQVARTLGVTGADIVQMIVLERVGGRAVDDFTVIWPAAAPVDRILAGLGAIPGVAVDGVWRSTGGAPAIGGADAELVGQVAVSADGGIATLVDAVPGLLSADWAAALVVPADWASAGGGTAPRPAVAYASWQAPNPLTVPDVTPLRPRAFKGPDGVLFATAPFGRDGVVLLVARRGGEAGLPVPAFHTTEVDRLAQLVRACGLVLGDRLEGSLDAPASSGPGHRPVAWPLNPSGSGFRIDLR